MHHPSPVPSERSAFLPQDVLLRGQLEHQQRQISRCLNTLSGTGDAGAGLVHLALAVLLVARELEDLGISVEELWSALLTCMYYTHLIGTCTYKIALSYLFPRYSDSSTRF